MTTTPPHADVDSPPFAGRVTSAHGRFPEGRYGRRRAVRRYPRWIFPGLMIAVVAVGLAVALRMYDTFVGDHVQSQITAFTVVSNSSIRIKFQVVKEAGKPATCIVRARAEDGQEVGRAEVKVPAGSKTQESIVVSYTIPTSKRAVTGEVYACAPY